MTLVWNLWTDSDQCSYNVLMYLEGSANPLRNLFDAAARGYSIKLTCWSCSHVRILHGHGLWWLFDQRGWLDNFKAVRWRLVCGPCLRERNQKIRNPKLELVHEEITGDPLPLPSESEWKRALRRHR